MLALHGVGTCTGVGDGPLYLYHSPDAVPKPASVEDAEAETSRFETALQIALAELCAPDKASDTARAPEQSASAASGVPAPCEEQIALLENPDFLEAARAAISEHHLCAEYAVYSTGKAFADQLATLPDEASQARSTHVREVTLHLVNLLSEHARDALAHVQGRVVLAADTLLPGQAMQLDHKKIAALLMRTGGASTYTAILLRELGIPTVVGLGDDFYKLELGVRTMVDGSTGLVAQNPDTHTMSELAGRMLQLVKDERTLKMLRGQSAVTQNGVRIVLSANIGLPEDAKKAIACDAEGIGLFRSELLYLQKNPMPDEDTLYHAYREALLCMGGKRVVVRLLDPGTDKSALFPARPAETNPALGYRAVPAALTYPQLLLPQLRALLRASAYGRLAILLPMVVNASEVREMKEQIGQCRTALKKEGRIVGGRVEVGALIETPAAALTADLLAQECDFLSIGTNDLTQYMLVADRRSPEMAADFNPLHPSVMRAIAQIVHAAHAVEVPVSICGESAANPALAGFFAGLHVDELSMSPSSILQMKRAIRFLNEDDCKSALRHYLCASKRRAEAQK